MADNEFATILLGGNVNSKKITVLSGNNLSKGDIVAQTASAKPVITGDGVATYSIVLGKRYIVGDYVLTCTTATSGSVNGVFSVHDPNGAYLGVLTLGTEFSNAQMTLTVTEGATPFTAGDIITVTVAKTGKYVLVDSASVAGGLKPEGILLEDADGTKNDVTGAMWITGEFDSAQLSVGTGLVAQYWDELRGLGIILKSVSGGNY